jgi:ParB/RepB/Spo0J family partition protein
VARGTTVDPLKISKNPANPRLYFNDDRLDQLRTSLQETGILVPLIVYEDPQKPGSYVLMDGERRWRSALDLAFAEVPVSLIDPPSPVENVLRMFNIHSVREEWSLVAIALSLKNLMALTGEQGESRLAEMTGLTRSTVRRAKRLLSLPEAELERIQAEAHLDRSEQVHREDLYLEIERAESVLRKAAPAAMEPYSREHVIRQFARKREDGSLRASTDFRVVGKMANVANRIDSDRMADAVRELVVDIDANPADVYEEVAASAFQDKEIERRARQLGDALTGVGDRGRPLSSSLRERLRDLRERIDALLGNG